jgi:NADH:ubiquinone oxidoreductase subunit 3 (subunit A)
MIYDYVALAIFSVLAFFVPFSLIMFSKIAGAKSPGNNVKNAPYESAEASIGKARDVDNEYMPFFALFLPMEIITAMLVVWVYASQELSYYFGLGIITLGVLSSLVCMAGYKIATGK